MTLGSKMTASLGETSLGDPRTFFQRQLPHVLRDNNDGNLPEDVAVAIHVDGDGGGAWTLSRSSGPAEIGPLQSGPFDCEIHCSSTDFMDIIAGKLSATRAFMDGRVKIQGDIGLILRLQGLLSA